MRVAITGASGLLGTAVSARLTAAGHAVTRLVRSRAAARAPDALFWNPATGAFDRAGLEGHDAVVHLAGENIAGYWTAAKKRRLRDSRVGGTRLVAGTLAAMDPARRPATLIAASASGYFGDRHPDRPLTEDDPPGDTLMARLVRDWEAAADPARAAGVRVVHFRFGVVIDRGALLLRASALATRLGLGATFSSGRQVLPWITLEDVAGLVLFALERTDIEGRYNAAAPQRTTNRDYADTLARVLHRPRFLRIPAPFFRLLGDLGQEVLGGAWVAPARLEAAGYPWREGRLEPALRRILDRPAKDGAQP